MQKVLQDLSLVSKTCPIHAHLPSQWIRQFCLLGEIVWICHENSFLHSIIGETADQIHITTIKQYWYRIRRLIRVAISDKSAVISFVPNYYSSSWNQWSLHWGMLRIKFCFGTEVAELFPVELSRFAIYFVNTFSRKNILAFSKIIATWRWHQKVPHL